MVLFKVQKESFSKVYWYTNRYSLANCFKLFIMFKDPVQHFTQQAEMD